MLYLFITFALLAAGITANKMILDHLSPAWFVAIRMSLAGVILILYNARSLNRATRLRLLEDWKLLFFIALCTSFAPTLLKAFGLKHMFAAKSTLLASMDPFFTALYAYLLWKEKLTWPRLAAILLGCLGVLIMVLARTPQEIGWEALWVISYPELATLLSVAISRFGWIKAQELMRGERFTPTQINGVVMLISGLISIGVALLSEGVSEPLTDLPLSMFLLFLASILGSNVIGYAMYAHSLKTHSATLVSLAGFLVPLLVAFFAYLFLDEPITWPFLAAAGCILAGLLLFYIDAKSKLKS